LKVATARIVLSLPGNSSLKGKRKIVRRILDRARHRFNAAIAEVDDLDVLTRAVLGIAVVSNDVRHANSMIDTVQDFVATASEAIVIDRRMEMLHVGDLDDDWQGFGDDG